MSMAVKYGLMKKARMAKGGMACECGGAGCPTCRGGKKMAEGGETSTTGNKTKTGGSNPGGASTGGAGTVTITTGKIPPKSISIDNVGGNTEARNAGGMDPGDEGEDKMMAAGGDVHPEDDDLVMRIMKKRYALGGRVESEPVADFEPADFDAMDDMDIPDDADYTGANSGDELGNDQKDEDERDIIARIMRSRSKKDRMPRPA